MGTLSKALGSLGGFAAGSETLIEYLINFSRPFIFATALPPSAAAAALASLTLLEKDKNLLAKLWRHVAFVQTALSAAGLLSGEVASPIFPIILGAEETALKASTRLLEEGFFVPAIRPPTVPKGKARLRLTVSAAHSDREIEEVVQAVIRAVQG